MSEEQDAREEQLQTFLRELYELSAKYDLWIGSCGCCDSPYVMTRARHPVDGGGKLIAYHKLGSYLPQDDDLDDAE